MTIKTRGSMSDVFYNFSQYVKSTGVTTDRVSGPKGPPNSFEWISDESPRFKRFGNCDHIKYSGNSDDDPIENTWTIYSPGVGHRQDRLHDFFIDSVDWAQLNAEAYLTMKPSLSAGFSLTNFLIELKELKFMFKLWRRSKSLISNVASAHLNWSFGWKLFISDLIELHRKLANMEKTLLDYKSRQGRTMVRHYKQSLPDKTNEITQDYGSYLWRSVGDIKRDFHATMRFHYVVPGIDSEYAKIKGILDVLGLRLTPSIVWEAIPFSFVVDWFLSVGDYLRSLEDDHLESIVTIEDFCCSVKSTVVAQQTGQYDGFSRASLYHYTATRYFRRRMLPNANDFGIVLSDRYGKKQILLSAALVLA